MICLYFTLHSSREVILLAETESVVKIYREVLVN